MDPHLGRSLGRYRLERLVAAGAQGRVYLARQAGLDRPVAVKVLAVPGDAEGEARLRREARAAARVAHPAVARVYDVGREGALHYLAQEYVDGETLAARLEQEGPLAPAEALRLAARLADGVAAIHTAGLVHRDLKPEHVILSPAGPRIVDFGLVRLPDASAALTRPGLLVGTPLYAAPEQVGAGGAVGPEADVYALGCLLHQALTGAVPHDTGERSLRAFLARRAAGAPPDLDGALGALPGPARDLLARMLARRPGDRPSAREVHRRLSAEGGAGASPSAGVAPAAPPRVAAPVGRVARPTGGLIVLAALGAGALVGGLLATRGLRSPAGPPPAPLRATASEPPASPASLQPPTGDDVSADAALDLALAHLAALRLDAAEAALTRLAADADERVAAEHVLALLRRLNAADRLPAAPPAIPWGSYDAWAERAPRTEALVRAFGPGLAAYEQARGAAERRQPVGVVLHVRRFERLGGADLAEPAPFLRPERRPELDLLRELARVLPLTRTDPLGAAAELDGLLESEAAATDLGRSLAPWLTALRDRVRARGAWRAR